MNINYHRRGGRKPPRDNEQLEIDENGNFTLWRSVGWATTPPTPVGHFAGQLPAAEHDALCQQATVAAADGNFKATPKPDAAIETIKVDDAQARMGNHEKPAGPWGDLADHLRQLLVDLTERPKAALSLELDKGGKTARLVHLGSDSLRLDLSDLTVRAVLWEGQRKAGDWSAPADKNKGKDTNASAGWSLDLPFAHGFDLGGNKEVVAYVTLTLYKGNQRIPVSLLTARNRNK